MTGEYFLLQKFPFERRQESLRGDAHITSESFRRDEICRGRGAITSDQSSHHRSA